MYPEVVITAGCIARNRKEESKTVNYSKISDVSSRKVVAHTVAPEFTMPYEETVLASEENGLNG